MQKSETYNSLLETLSDVLADLEAHSPTLPLFPGHPGEMKRFIDQCLEFAEVAPPPYPVRSIHHFACTGGTLVSKLIGAMPNTMLLSEIDPLSRALLKVGQPQFAPTDLLYGMRNATRTADDEMIVEVFKGGLQALHTLISDRGLYLVLRDHPHSQFCTDADFNARPTLLEIVSEILPVCSIVTVRHPLDSFLSINHNGWRTFEPFTLDEYGRRYLAFLDRHANLPLFRYESLVETPMHTLKAMCATLELPYSETAESLLPDFSLSGNSGRKSDTIGKRSRRAVPDWIHEQIKHSRIFDQLCDRLEYSLD